MALLSAYLSGWLVLLGKQAHHSVSIQKPQMLYCLLLVICLIPYYYTVVVLCIDYSTFVSDCIDCLVLYTIALLGNTNGMCLV